MTITDSHLRAEGLTPAFVSSALDGDARAARVLVDAIRAVVRVRVARQLARLGARKTQHLDLDAADLAQELLAKLYERDGRLLRQWDPDGGLSLLNWVGLVVQRALQKRVRSSVRMAWDAFDPRALEAAAAHTPHAAVEARAELGLVLQGLDRQLSRRARRILLDLLNEDDVRSAAERAGMSEQAIYAARLRLRRLAREFSMSSLRPD